MSRMLPLVLVLFSAAPALASDVSYRDAARQVAHRAAAVEPPSAAPTPDCACCTARHPAHAAPAASPVVVRARPGSRAG